MGILGEMAGEAARDLDFTRPRVVVTQDQAVLENVAGIVMLSETAVTVRHGLKLAGSAGRRAEGMARQMFTTITGSDLVICQICEGRIVIGGRIQKAEFLRSQGTGTD